MKCSKCGAEIGEGSLYCEKCGADIHIVPDFEPELDDHLSAYMSGIAAYTEGTGSPEDSRKEGVGTHALKDRKEEKKKGKGKKGAKYAMLLCGAFIFLLSVFVGIRIWLYCSYGYQVKKADSLFAREDYGGAAAHYIRALELDGSDAKVCLRSAEACLQSGNLWEYENILKDVIRNPECTREQLLTAYGGLVALYRSREEYGAINALLWEHADSAIQDIYKEYLVTPPEFNYEEGTYTAAIPLKLTSDGGGKIYYTVDGSDPTVNGLLYTAPILLEKDCEVRAVTVSQYGVASDVAVKKYRII